MNDQQRNLNDSLQIRFANDQDMIAYITRRSEETQIFHSNYRRQSGAFENYRLINENIEKFTQELIRIRIDHQYNRVLSELLQAFPDVENEYFRTWKNYWKEHKALENKCGYYCTLNLLNNETDEFIKAIKNELILSGYEERVDHIDQNLKAVTPVYNYRRASWSQQSDGEQVIDDDERRKREEAQILEYERLRHIQIQEQAVMQPKQMKEENRKIAYKDLTSNLLIWYPSSLDRSSFDHKLVSFIRHRNFTTSLLQQIASNKNAFENAIFSTETMNHFASTYKDEMISEIRYISDMILWNKHKNIADYHKMISSRLENEVENSQLDSIYLVWKLEDKIKKALNNVMMESYNTAMADLESKLNEWNPNSQTFNSKFIDFLRVTKPSLGTIKTMAAQRSNQFYSSNNKFLKDFFDRNRHNFIVAMFVKVNKILHKLDPNNEERNMNLLRYKKIGQQFTIEMMGNQLQLEKLVNAEINKVNKCIEGLSDRIKNIINNATMFEYFSDNHCIADEICLKNSDISERDLKTKLIPYVAVYSESRADPFAKNIQRKERNKNAIYHASFDLIQTFVRDKFKVNGPKAQCFVDFLRRSEEFKQVYSAEAIFDDHHDMWNKIEPLVQKYVDKYLIQLENTN